MNRHMGAERLDIEDNAKRFKELQKEQEKAKKVNITDQMDKEDALIDEANDISEAEKLTKELFKKKKN